jgi:hypothetical protein
MHRRHRPTSVPNPGRFRGIEDLSFAHAEHRAASFDEIGAVQSKQAGRQLRPTTSRSARTTIAVAPAKDVDESVTPPPANQAFIALTQSSTRSPADLAALRQCRAPSTAFLPMTTTERISKAMTEKFAAIAALTDAFCAQPLDAEHRRMILRVVRAQAAVALAGWRRARVGGRGRACGGSGERFACGSRGGVE